MVTFCLYTQIQLSVHVWENILTFSQTKEEQKVVSIQQICTFFFVFLRYENDILDIQNLINRRPCQFPKVLSLLPEEDRKNAQKLITRKIGNIKNKFCFFFRIFLLFFLLLEIFAFFVFFELEKN